MNHTLSMYSPKTNLIKQIKKKQQKQTNKQNKKQRIITDY